MERTLVSLAVVAVLALVVAPVATMVAASLSVDYVETADGEIHRGHIRDSDADGVSMRVHGETTTRRYDRERIVREGRMFSLLNYETVLHSTDRQAMFLATIALAGASTLLALVIGLPVALLLAATNLPGRRILENLVVLPLVLPPILLAIATYHDLLDLRPEFFRAVLVFGLSLFPLVTLFTTRALRATAADALDAARLQVRPAQALLRVALRPALPGAAAGALLVFTFVVSDFAVPDFLGVTTAKNTIPVFANAVFRYWKNDGDAGAATAVGMAPTLLALAAFLGVLYVERRRAARTLASGYRPPHPLPLGRARWPALLGVGAVLAAALAWPTWRHLETAGGAHFGDPVASGRAGAPARVVDESRARPESVADGLRKGLQHERVDEATWTSCVLALGGALVAVLLAILVTEAGRAWPRLDPVLLVASFLPIAVPPMCFAVGWVTLFGTRFAAERYAPVLLLGARLLPFALFAVRATRMRIGAEMQEAAAAAGLSPFRRLVRVTLPLVGPGVALGLLLAFLFGLREVDALVFTRTGAETLPVKLYDMIHYGYDVQVAGLSFLWTAGIALLLVVITLLTGRRFRVSP